MSAFWSGHVGAAAGCCFKVLQSKWCVRFGVGMLVPLQELQGAVVGFFSEAAGGVV